MAGSEREVLDQAREVLDMAKSFAAPLCEDVERVTWRCVSMDFLANATDLVMFRHVVQKAFEPEITQKILAHAEDLRQACVQNLEAKVLP